MVKYQCSISRNYNVLSEPMLGLSKSSVFNHFRQGSNIKELIKEVGTKDYRLTPQNNYFRTESHSGQIILYILCVNKYIFIQINTWIYVEKYLFDGHAKNRYENIAFQWRQNSCDVMNNGWCLWRCTYTTIQSCIHFSFWVKYNNDTVLQFNNGNVMIKIDKLTLGGSYNYNRQGGRI